MTATGPQTEEQTPIEREDRDLARPPCRIIEPESGWQPIDLRELWRYRELLHFFAWRDIKVRYKQTELGVAWAVLEPLLTTGVFAVLFGVLLGKGNEPGVQGVPYALSTFCAMLPWQLFSEASTRSSESLLTGQNLVTKVYFPRMILPLSAVVTGLVDFVILLVVLLVMMAFWGVAPSWNVVALPAFVLLAVMASMAIGLWLSALSAIYRDFRYAQPVLIRLGMFVSPVVYVSAEMYEKLPGWLTIIYGLNPMVAVIEGFRWALLPGAAPLEWSCLPSVLMTVILLVSGMFFFLADGTDVCGCYLNEAARYDDVGPDDTR